ncbi:MAG: tRNA lysidine(34) synthetase TilS [Planctomycetes bacterium]|nr:tRNA lysidine(34) synthetase TilS [Planctomycetota bacterium]NOG54314.1 tRNA lysidine(34) synthetase TilS [Planctomycetota bacterium]
MLSRALQHQCQVTPHATLIVAVSGGADSLALLAALSALARRPHLAYTIRVAHVNHRLRAEAEQEAQQVQHIAQQLDLPCDTVALDPSAATSNTSAWARRERYRALAQIAEEHSAHAVVTAHHGTDQLETLLLNLMRGTGTAGLAAMRWRKRVYGCDVIRPLLNQTHQACVQLCESIGWSWVEDPSNGQISQRRNRIRAQLLPVVEQIAPGLDARIHRMTDQLADLSQFLSLSAQDLIEEAQRTADAGTASIEFDRSVLAAAHRVVVAEAIRKSAVQLGAPARKLNASTLTAAARAVMDSHRHPRTIELAGDVTVRVTSRTVRMDAGRTGGEPQ